MPSKICKKNNKKAVSAIITVAVFIAFLLIIFFLTFVPPNIGKISSDYSEKYGLDRNLICAVIKAESGFDERATSSKGACGLMQLLPSTYEFVAQKYSLQEGDIYNPERNIEAGCAYLHYLFERFSTVKEVLCAYNAGEGVVSGWLADEKYSSDGATLNVIPYKVTEKYVQKILLFYNFYKGF